MNKVFLAFIRRYSAGLPTIRTQWFYATAIPITKPKHFLYKQEEKPSKFVPFSAYDLARLEKHFFDWKAKQGNLKLFVEVNEDRLFQVDFPSMQLKSVYWNGPVYEVRRVTWFTSDGVPLENDISKELEDNFNTTKPWEFKNEEKARQLEVNKDIVQQFKTLAGQGFPKESTIKASEELRGQLIPQDPTKGVKELSNDMKVLFADAKKASIFPKTVEEPFELSVIRNFTTSSAPLPQVTKVQRGYSKEMLTSFFDSLSTASLPAISDLFHNSVDTPNTSTQEDQEKQNQDQMQLVLENDYDLETTNKKSHRSINHLVLSIHGVGQILSVKHEAIDFPHSVNVLRNTMKKVFQSDEKYQQMSGDKDSNTIQILPISWRHDIEFNPLRDSNPESFSPRDKNLPSLGQLTVDGIKPIRGIIGEVLLDILLYYEPYYNKLIMSFVIKEMNRVYKLYKERNPNFRGKVHILGHSLGSAIAFDVMLSQNKKGPKESQLEFEVDSLFCVGAPVGMFKLIRRKNIRSRLALGEDFDPNDPESEYASPKVRNLYNVFHPSDPVAYRMEPLVSPRFANFQPELVPFATKGFSTQIKDIGEGLLKLQSTLFGRGTDMAGKAKKKVQKSSLNENALSDILAGLVLPEATAKAHEVDMRERDLLILKTLNNTGRIDFCLQQGMFDFLLVSAVSAHVLYFEDEDTAAFVMKEILTNSEEEEHKKVAVYKMK